MLHESEGLLIYPLINSYKAEEEKLKSTVREVLISQIPINSIVQNQDN